MSGEVSSFCISVAKPLIRSLARRNRLLVLSARIAAAFVSTAGAATRDSNANGFEGTMSPARRRTTPP